MTGVILAIHGVANRNEKSFASSIEQLATNLGLRYPDDVRPVYWGDLGPPAVDRLASIPAAEDGTPLPGTRDAFDVPAPADPADARVLADRTIAALAQRTDTVVDLETEQQIRDALDDAASRGASLALQADLSDALAEVIASAEPAGAPQVGTRGIGDGVGRLVGKVVDAFDREAGRMLGQLLQKGFRGAEGGLSRSIATTVGDVLTYERTASTAAGIRGRLDEAVAEAGAGGASEIHVLAHSLGGLVTVEWLLGAPAPHRAGSGTDEIAPEDRRINLLVTFGSQVSLFSELHGLLGAGERTWAATEPLPIAVERWVNVWHQLDPLAFTIGTVLKTSNAGGGGMIEDFRLGLAGVPTSASDLSFHSSYWTDTRLLTWLRGLLT